MEALNVPSQSEGQVYIAVLHLVFIKVDRYPAMSYYKFTTVRTGLSY